MHDQLTENDIQQMKEELDYRRITLRPKLLEEVKTARAFGDLKDDRDGAYRLRPLGGGRGGAV